MTRVRIWSVGLPDWPAKDRAVWERAFTPADSLFDEDDGKVPHELGASACRKIREAYGFWLHYLMRCGELDAQASPAARVTRTRLDGWMADQRARGNGSTTLYGRLRDLHRSLSLMDPNVDVGFILRPGGRSLRRLLKPKPRWCEIRDSRELLARALELFRAGCEGRGYARGQVALRDAALLGLLAAHGPRIRSVGAMEIGEHIVRTDAGYRVHFGEKDIKTKVLMTYDLHPELVPVFDRYISAVRSSLAGSASSAALWIGTRGKALSANDLGKMVRWRTKAWFGREQGPHWFRKCLRTTASFISPEAALDAGVALGHSPGVSITHYLKSRATETLRRHGGLITRLRKETWSLAASVYGWRDSVPAAGTSRPRRTAAAAKRVRRKVP